MSVEYNWAAAFIAFTRNNPPEDIAQTFAIPLSTLKNKIRTEGWARLASDYLPAVVVPDRAERDLSRIQANRESNLKVVEDLQADLVTIVGKLKAGTLKFKKALSNGLIVEMEPTLKDRADLANYAKGIFEAGYRALGDVVAGRGEGEGALPAGAVIVNVNLPGPVAQPRLGRTYEVEAEAVTVESPMQRLPYEGNAAADVKASETEAYMVPMGG